jgi:hypothetical protein
LCQAVYATLKTEGTNTNDLMIRRNVQLTFHRVCLRVFSIFEANSESALPLFIDEDAQVYITYIYLHIYLYMYVHI